MNELLIGLFAIAGGMTRYGVDQLLVVGHLPVATFTINLVGSFLLVFLTNTLAQIDGFPAQLILGLGTGFIGAFTTFSSYIFEIWQLYQAQAYWLAAGYALLSLVAGLLGAYLGLHASQLDLKRLGKREVSK
ncbi:fluoride efflux transporter FluC [Loigolactobacillus coryniformis]|uniref:fluoride efflux transporter FluC n=1 Tax=Loigolactobacillus coryniformis TaxID=1610 RepID=UPI0002195986|nr:CrcB family protein [Loigolactobacillus coryniformis]KRK84901.1 camphor resistance protein CrcB [Loigolactobacillus coryniformis subsp. torquens DSM 20004 = KCTC 3535]